MINVRINGLPISLEKGTTILEAAKFLGFPIPTLCHMEGLNPYGACRICVVEISEGERAKLVSSCTYPIEEGMKVRTASSRVLRAGSQDDSGVVAFLIRASGTEPKIRITAEAKTPLRAKDLLREGHNLVKQGKTA